MFDEFFKINLEDGKRFTEFLKQKPKDSYVIKFYSVP